MTNVMVDRSGADHVEITSVKFVGRAYFIECIVLTDLVHQSALSFPLHRGRHVLNEQRPKQLLRDKSRRYCSSWGDGAVKIWKIDPVTVTSSQSGTHSKSEHEWRRKAQDPAEGRFYVATIH